MTNHRIRRTGCLDQDICIITMLLCYCIGVIIVSQSDEFRVFGRLADNVCDLPNQVNVV